MHFGLITGIPRSGTTLAAALVDQYDDAVCLSEPLEHVRIMETSESPDHFVRRLIGTMADSHDVLGCGGAIVDRRAPDGAAITNYFATSKSGRRPAVATSRTRSKSGLAPDFFLCAKHNALYTGVLAELIIARSFKIVAIVRHPVPVIASWRSLALPISRGRLPAGERYWPELRSLTNSDQPLLRKQVLIFELLCRRYLEHQDAISILRYEDIRLDPHILGNCFGLKPSIDLDCRLSALIEPANTRSSTELIVENIIDLAKQGLLPATTTLYPL